jgi:hypothetical protein
LRKVDADSKEFKQGFVEAEWEPTQNVAATN